MSKHYFISETIAVTNANTVMRSWNRDTGLVDTEGTVIDAQGLPGPFRRRLRQV